MNEIKLILFLACMAILIAEVYPFVEWIKNKMKWKRLKPLDCVPCLSFWISLASLPFGGQVYFLALVPVVALIILKFIR